MRAFKRSKTPIPDYLKPVVIFAYNTGWRRSEILNLTWGNVDLKERTVCLEPGEIKNDEGPLAVHMFSIVMGNSYMIFD
jgi:integrase